MEDLGMTPSQTTSRLAQAALSLVGVLLTLRFVLRLLNADATNRFISWVYDTTAPAVHPFFNWFPQVRSGDGFIFEWATLFALVSYTVLTFAVLSVVGRYKTPANSVAKGNRRFSISFNR